MILGHVARIDRYQGEATIELLRNHVALHVFQTCSICVQNTCLAQPEADLELEVVRDGRRRKEAAHGTCHERGERLHVRNDVIEDPKIKAREKPR